MPNATPQAVETSTAMRTAESGKFKRPAGCDNVRKDEPRERDECGADRDADHAPEKCKHDRFNEKLLENVAVGCADGFSKTDFAGTFNDRYKHNVHDADTTDDERDGGDGGKEKRENRRDIAEKRENILLRLDRKIVFVGVCDAMVMLKDGFDARFHEGDVIGGIGRREYIIEIGDAKHLALGNGDRNDGKIVLIDAAGSGALWRKDADHAERRILETDIFADGVHVRAKEGACKVGTDNSDMVIGGYIGRSERVTVRYGKVSDRKEIGGCSLIGDCKIVVSIDRICLAAYQGYHGIDGRLA